MLSTTVWIESAGWIGAGVGAAYAAVPSPAVMLPASKASSITVATAIAWSRTRPARFSNGRRLAAPGAPGARSSVDVSFMR
jgi:hypothetical protein